MTAVSQIIDAFSLGGPLVSCWNVRGGWNLNQQVAWIREGKRYLPAIFCPTLAQRANKQNVWDDYFAEVGESLKWINDNKLPVAVRFHNLGGDFYADNLPRAPFEKSALVFKRTPDGTLNDGKLLCPLAPTEPWADEGKAIATSLFVQKLAEVLPDVPRIFFLENNEAPLAEIGFYTDVLKEKDQWGFKLRAWKPSLETLSVRMAEWAKTHKAGEAEAAIHDGFVRQRQAMVAAIKANCPAAWKGKVYVGGYGGLGSLATAGIDDKQTFSFKRPQNNWAAYPFAPEAYEFDVASGRCYDAGSGGGFNTMHTVRGPQCLEHNLAPLHRHCEETRPLWHLDRSFWVQPGRCRQEKEDAGEYILPSRVKGFARACLWATKANKTATVFRWFADSDETLDEPWFKGDNYVAELQHVTRGDYFAPSVEVVEEVWNDKRLLKFWHEGVPVLNSDPPLCRWEMPPEVVDDRSRVLSTDADPPRFVDGKDTWRAADGKLELKVFAQAWRIGESFLVYAWSPRGTRPSVIVDLPGSGKVEILNVGQEGVFKFAGKALRERSQLELNLDAALEEIISAGEPLNEAKMLVWRALAYVTAWEDAK